MIPYPDPVVIRLLATLPVLSGVVDDRVSDVSTTPLPSLRIVKVTDKEPPSTWEATPIYQIEVWADTTQAAGQIAWDIANHWPTARAETVSPVDSTPARVHGRWVSSNPYSSPDPKTGLPRQILTVGIRLSGVTP